jgi:hypothetical protein
MTLPEDEPGGDQPADDESQTAESPSETAESPSETESPSEPEPFLKSGDSRGDAPEPDPSTVHVDTTQLDRAQDAIEDARAAVKRVAATDSIDEEATGAGELPAFADSVAGVEKPKPPEDDTASDVEDDSED